jgi:thiosulfate dehydrogenase [quinone] large subunit
MKKITLGLVRILLGWTFLWAFFDKLFGLGFATIPERAWMSGGSPTSGFLMNATKGPFAEYFQMLAGQPWVDWLFMIGLLLIGISFITGVWVKYSGWFGALMMLLMYVAGFMPPENNPVVDDHIIYAILFIYFAIDPKQELNE